MKEANVARAMRVPWQSLVNAVAGSGAIDAVNVSQRTATNAAIATETASRAAAGAALSSRMENLSFDIHDTAREGRGVTAAALAAAGLPQAQGDERTMIVAGLATIEAEAL